MGIKKFIVRVQESFQFDKLQKKESTKRLLVKLRARKETFKKIDKEKMGIKDLTEIKEDLAIITLQIKKGEDLLKKLSV